MKEEINRPGVSIAMLIKFVIIVTTPAIFILLIAGILGAMSLDGVVYSYCIILFFTGIILRPFLFNVSELTSYVNDLLQDRQVGEPSLRYLNSVSDLPQALINLKNSWENKKKRTATVITEYETLVDSLPDILIMCNNEQKIVRTNKVARELFGQNLAGKTLSNIIQNDDFLNGIASVVEEREGRTLEFHLDMVAPRDFRAIIEFFPTASGEGISLIITLNDVTALRRIGKMRADFVANASHEIRTPLASIKGLVETLRGPAKDDVAVHDEFLRIIDEQATRMKNLIDDLLSLSKIEMTEHTTPQGKADILKILRNEKELFAWATQEKNMTIRLEMPDDLPLVRGEESELMQVLHNLIGNAIKYGSSGTEVVISARVTSVLPNDPNFIKVHRAVAISVIDHGEGISREHLPRLTERFYRVDSARTRAIGGTGLGLAIVKHIIHRHHGVLSIDSVVGEGSTFTTYLHLYA